MGPTCYVEPSDSGFGGDASSFPRLGRSGGSWPAQAGSGRLRRLQRMAVRRRVLPEYLPWFFFLGNPMKFPSMWRSRRNSLHSAETLSAKLAFWLSMSPVLRLRQIFSSRPREGGAPTEVAQSLSFRSVAPEPFCAQHSKNGSFSFCQITFGPRIVGDQIARPLLLKEFSQRRHLHNILQCLS